MNLKLAKLTKLAKCVHPNRKPSQITNKTVFKTKVCVYFVQHVMCSKQMKLTTVS